MCQEKQLQRRNQVQICFFKRRRPRLVTVWTESCWRSLFAGGNIFVISSWRSWQTVGERSPSNALMSLKRFRTEPVGTGVPTRLWCKWSDSSNHGDLLQQWNILLTLERRKFWYFTFVWSFVCLSKACSHPHVSLRNCGHSPNVCSCSPHWCPLSFMGLEQAKHGLNIKVRRTNCTVEDTEEICNVNMYSYLVGLRCFIAWLAVTCSNSLKK